jgi:anti-sigma B factor antagonist
MQMDLVDLSETIHQVSLSGRLDAIGVERLETRFTALLSGTAKDAIVDLTAVDFCGSLAIRMFLTTARVMQRRDRRMVIAGAQPQVTEVFQTVALNSVIPLVATPGEARARLEA